MSETVQGRTADDAKRDFLKYILIEGAERVINRLDEQVYDYFAESDSFEADMFEWWLIGLMNEETGDAERWAKQIWDLLVPARTGNEPMLGSKDTPS
jgi:hypothetical protein